MNKLYLNKNHVYTFEDRIDKHKLPKGLSYVLQTTDIANVLTTDGLSLSYSYSPDNPQKVEKQLGVKRFSFTKVELLGYHKHRHRGGEPGAWDDYDRSMVVYSVPAKLRKALRFALTSNILPRLKAFESLPKFNLSVYYRVFDKDFDRGGLYIEQDRYNDKAKVLYRDKEFDLDKEIRECVL